jgi:hypothetical protein
MSIGLPTKRWWLLVLPVLFLLATLPGFGVMAGSSSQSQAAGFTEKSLQGTYGFSAEGVIVPPLAPEDTTIPAVVVGIMTFDGEGGCSISDTANLGGESSSNTTDAEGGSCTYTVNSDGTGTIEAVLLPNPGDTPLSFVIINKREFRFIRTDPGVAVGVAERQRGDDDDG